MTWISENVIQGKVKTVYSEILWSLLHFVLAFEYRYSSLMRLFLPLNIFPFISFARFNLKYKMGIALNILFHLKNILCLY